MQIEVKELEPCYVHVHYHAEPTEIASKRKEILKYFKKAPVPGFRPGKASVDAIKIHYKNQINESLKRALAEEAFHNTLFEKNIKPHGVPKFNSLFLGDGKFSCEFEMRTKPVFELAPYKNLEIPKPHEPASVIEIAEKVMQELRIKTGEVVPYKENDVVQFGDKIVANYEISIDGVVDPSLSAEGEIFNVGSTELPDFDTNIIGMALSESREFNIIVPENGLPSLVGKTAKIKVTLISGSKIIPSPLDDSLAIKCGKKDFTELKSAVQLSAQARHSMEITKQLNAAVSARLVDDNKFEIPYWMTLSEAQMLTHNAKINWNDLSDVDKDKMIKIAEQNVKLSLILDKIRESEPEAQLTEQEIFNIIQDNIKNNNQNNSQSIQEILMEMSKSGYLQVLVVRIKDEHTLDFVVKNSQIKE